MRLGTAIAVVIIVLLGIVSCNAAGNVPAPPGRNPAPVISSGAPATQIEPSGDSGPAATPHTPEAASAPSASNQLSTGEPGAAAPRVDSASSPYDELLRMIPDTPDTRKNIHINDYNRIRSGFGLLLRGPEDEDFRELLVPRYSKSGEWATLPRPGEDVYFGPFDMYRVARNEDINQNLHYLAFDYGNMEQSIIAPGAPYGSSTDGRLEVIRGGFEPEDTRDAIMACSECSEPSVNEHRGVSYYGWGDDYVMNFDRRFDPPVFDQAGRGGHVAVLDSYVIRTLGEREMKTLIDVSLNEGRSLADVEEFRVLASGMNELGAYAMYLSDDVELWALDEYLEALREDERFGFEGHRSIENTGPWLRPFEAFAVGVGEDEDGVYMALVLLHADDVSAKENVERLRRIVKEERSAWTGDPWSAHFDVERLEIDAEGYALLSKLGVPSSAFWIKWLLHADSLILYE